MFYNYGYNALPPFVGFTEFNGVIPQLYWNVASAEQRYHLICKQLHKLICYSNALNGNLNTLDDEVQELITEFLKFKESGFNDYYAEQIKKWIAENMPEIIGNAAKMVWFGLTQDGYFVAYIPDSWDDIIFDTDTVPDSEKYGRLILSWNVDNS